MADADNNVDVRLAVVEKDVTNINVVISHFDQVLDKLSDISASLKELLAVHDVRIANAEKDIIKNKTESDDMYNKIEEVKKDFEDKLEKVKKSVTKLNYFKFILIGIGIFILSKLNIPIPSFF